jgi:hypothetical protein
MQYQGKLWHSINAWFRTIKLNFIDLKILRFEGKNLKVEQV